MSFSVGLKESERHGVEQFWTLFLDIDGYPVNVKEPSVLANQFVQGYLSLSLTERYQVGKSAK
jgi:hypothetical protein